MFQSFLAFRFRFLSFSARKNAEVFFLPSSVLSNKAEVKREMQTSNVKTTLVKLLSLGKRVDKIRAALPANVVPGFSESESASQIEYAPLYRMARLEAEAQRARAEAMAHRLLNTLK
jgi:hypothetical protein